jgi:hypothetical protein
VATSPVKFPCPVRRIRLVWRDGKLSVQKEVRVPRMTLLKSAELPEAGARHGVSGFWFEATNAKGKVFYRRGMDDPTLPEMEVFEKDGSMRRMPSEREVVFNVLIPDLPEIREVRFFSSAQAPAKGRKRAAKPAAEPFAVVDIRHEKTGKGYGRR